MKRMKEELRLTQKLPDDPDKSGDQVTPTPTVEGGGQEGKNVATPQPFNKGGEVPVKEIKIQFLRC